MTIKGSQDGGPARPLRLGMVGGGRGAFIGAVHRYAAALDRRFALVAGALSSDPENARASAAELGIETDRAYSSYVDMAAAEGAREDGIEVVAIVTPNHLHFSPAKAFLEAGIHVICDKPLTSNLAEARELAEVVERSGCVFVLTQNNTGYPMIRQARQMIAEGALGKLRLINLSYIQDWLTDAIEQTGHKQAEWRMDPKRAGAAGVIADLGVHAFNLAEFITGLELESVAADLHSFGAGRTLDDNAHVLLRYKGGVRGKLWASQVAPGHNNSLSIGIYGDKGSLEWNGEVNDYLRFSPLGEPPRIITRGGPGATAVAAAATRIPGGHPEGYIEGFANLYGSAADLILAHRAGDTATAADVPGISAGLSGMRFIAACVASSHNDAAWARLTDQ